MSGNIYTKLICIIILQAALNTLPPDDSNFDQLEFEVNLKVQQLKIYVITKPMSQFMVCVLCVVHACE